jgi:hypothetical protein
MKASSNPKIHNLLVFVYMCVFLLFINYIYLFMPDIYSGKMLICLPNLKQTGQAMYVNLTLWCVHLTIVAMETQQRLLCVLLSKCYYQYKNTGCCTTVFSWWIYVASSNRTYFGLHVKCPILLFDFNQIRTFSTDLIKSQYQIVCKPAQRGVRWHRRT